MAQTAKHISFLAAIRERKDGIEGYYFRVWAAHAEGISVVGDFNDWDENATPMEKIDDSEVWEAFVTGLQTYDTYKYCIHGCDGKTHYKADPYGTHTWRSLEHRLKGFRYRRLSLER